MQLIMVSHVYPLEPPNTTPPKKRGQKHTKTHSTLFWWEGSSVLLFHHTILKKLFPSDDRPGIRSSRQGCARLGGESNGSKGGANPLFEYPHEKGPFFKGNESLTFQFQPEMFINIKYYVSFQGTCPVFENVWKR